MPGRILVIRSGALGDFILTLPAIGLLRENFPACHLEILGYRHIAAIAEGRFYANSTRSIDYGPLAGFFHPRAALDAGHAKGKSIRKETALASAGIPVHAGALKFYKEAGLVKG